MPYNQEKKTYFICKVNFAVADTVDIVDCTTINSTVDNDCLSS